ncbi:MAG: hypothetical protein Q9M91_00050 [Candidatus Dojkabacteria bacterium]|nr:hypothetical protein [Candidatus Dojkabacteria bacterium]MDQ7020223.1 hypothetical protein [Candidatus Dojkabacteria bacterium]
MVKTKIKKIRFIKESSEIESFNRENEKYNLDIELRTNNDINSFFSNLGNNSEEEYVLVLLGRVYINRNFDKFIELSIEKANKQYGEESWGAISPEGFKIYSDKETKPINFVKKGTNSTRGIPYNTKDLLPSSTLSNRVILINLKNIKDKSISFNITSAKNIGFNLAFTFFNSGLICLIDSLLFCIYDEESYLDKIELSSSYKNILNDETINTSDSNAALNGEGKINYKQLVINSFKLLDLKRKKLTFIARAYPGNSTETLQRRFKFLEQVISNNSSLITPKVLISANGYEKQSEKYLKLQDLIKTYGKLNIEFVETNDYSEKYPRVSNIENAVKHIKSEDSSYVIFVDGDDFTPNDNLLGQIDLVLGNETIIIGDSKKYNEKWEGDELKSQQDLGVYKGNKFYKNLIGGSYVPISSIIYPIKALKEVFKNHELKGDYLEDYFILLNSFKYANPIYYPIIIGGISFYEENTVGQQDRTHWLYSEADFMNEYILKNDYSSSIYKFTNSLGESARVVSDWEKAINRYNELEKFYASSNLDEPLNKDKGNNDVLEIADKFSNVLGLDELRTKNLRDIFSYSLNFVKIKNRKVVKILRKFNK